MLTHGILRAFRDGVHLYGQPPWGQSQVFQVAQLRADGIHCLESAGTELVDLKVVRVTGAAFSSITVDQLLCAPLFAITLLHYYTITLLH